jgi:hypothetical protein
MWQFPNNVRKINKCKGEKGMQPITQYSVAISMILASF